MKIRFYLSVALLLFGAGPFAFAQERNMSAEIQITAVVENYVQGYLQADPERVAQVFHPDTRLYSMDEGKLDKTEMPDWIENLKDRRARGDIRKAKFQIAHLDVTQDAAMVKVLLTFAHMQFTDYLSLLLINERWVIIGKIYTVKPLDVGL